MDDFLLDFDQRIGIFFEIICFGAYCVAKLVVADFSMRALIADIKIREGYFEAGAAAFADRDRKQAVDVC